MVDPGNAEQAKAWDGDEGAYWARHAERFDASVRPHHERLVAAAAVRPGERVLDIGCGTGAVTIDAARAADSGVALGVDLSSAMLDVARRRAREAGVGNAAFEQADAQVHAFDAAAFDVAVSRTGSMFFADPHAAFTNIASALRPGGRLVLVSWRDAAANEWFTSFTTALAAGRSLPFPPSGAPGPFAQAAADHVRELLGGTGFTDVALEPVDEPMWFGDDAADAHGFVLGLLGWLLEGLDEHDRRRASDALLASMRDHEGEAGVTYGSAAWLVTAHRP
jgi:SAM-dependent methyltransferase